MDRKKHWFLEDRVLVVLSLLIIIFSVLATIFCLLDWVVLFILSVFVIGVCGLSALLWFDFTFKVYDKLDFFCNYVKNNRVKFSELVLIFSMNFIERFFDISEGVADDSLVEVYIYPNLVLYKALRGKVKIGRIVNFGDNRGITDKQ